LGLDEVWGDICLLRQLIKLLGTILCHVDYPIGRRRCLGVVQKEAIVVVSCVYGKQPHVVLCFSWIDGVFAIGCCFLLYPLWLESIYVGETLLRQRGVERGKPKLDSWVLSCIWRVLGVYVFNAPAI
jgi:hypothetical protein